MSYLWKPSSGTFSATGLDAAGLNQRFDDQASAEEWLGLFHAELLQHGVAEVSLYEEDRLIFGPMSLLP